MKHFLFHYLCWLCSHRDRIDSCGGVATKASRERVRREKLNDRLGFCYIFICPIVLWSPINSCCLNRYFKYELRSDIVTKSQSIQSAFYPWCRFSELSAVLEPGRPVKTDKVAILNDAIRILNHLRTESQEYKETNERLVEEIQNLKVRQISASERSFFLWFTANTIICLKFLAFLQEPVDPIYNESNRPRRMNSGKRNWCSRQTKNGWNINWKPWMFLWQGSCQQRHPHQCTCLR